jgi:hypothetical protein
MAGLDVALTLSDAAEVAVAAVAVAVAAVGT